MTSALNICVLVLLFLASDSGIQAKKRNNNDDKTEKKAANPAHSARLPLNVTAVAGVDVDLRCKVRLHECGNFFSIEWYREHKGEQDPRSERVYVYRHHSGQAKAEGAWAGRASHGYDGRRHLMTVRLSPSEVGDDGYYRCEITYAEGKRWFQDACLKVRPR